MANQTSNIQDQTLPVMESFYTIQGEGFHQGRAAYFIRLGGCDVGCVWCDVKESWNADAHSKYSIEKIVEDAIVSVNSEDKSVNHGLAVITGGEPLMHSLDQLTAQLQAAGFETNIETSGSSPLTGTWNWICLSPNGQKRLHQKLIHPANCIYNRSGIKHQQ